MIIGITGGIGSGKSTVARELERQGYAVYDCDREAKRIIAEDADVRQAVIALLGEETFVDVQRTKDNGQRTMDNGQWTMDNGQRTMYNTAYVAKRVFDNPALLEQLNGIVHPAVAADILNVKDERETAKGLFFVESAILYEAGLDRLCDRIVAVDAPEDIRLARVIARDYQGEMTPANIDKVRARMRTQKVVNCQPSASSQQLIIQNDGRTSVSDLAEEIVRFCVV